MKWPYNVCQEDMRPERREIMVSKARKEDISNFLLEQLSGFLSPHFDSYF